MCDCGIYWDNLRALTSGLSYLQVDKLCITILTTYISVALAHHEIFCGKVGKGGITWCTYKFLIIYLSCFFNLDY